MNQLEKTIAIIERHICFEHLETNHCNHEICWRAIDLIKELKREHK